MTLNQMQNPSPCCKLLLVCVAICVSGKKEMRTVLKTSALSGIVLSRARYSEARWRCDCVSSHRMAESHVGHIDLSSHSQL